MEHRFESSLTLPLPRMQVFEFFCDAANLERITPPELRFRITTAQPIDMRAGALIDYQLSLFGVSFAWRTLISVWKPGEAFVDEQVTGPYKQWIHSHSFHDVPGGTRIDDLVRYRLPLEPLGDIALPMIRLQLARIFAYREMRVRQLLGR